MVTVPTPPKATCPLAPEHGTVHPVHLRPWALLDTAFTDNKALLQAHTAHFAPGAATSVLHYVALCSPEDLAAWRTRPTPAEVCANPSTCQDSADELSRSLEQIVGAALPGFQRILLEGGRLSLTLCVGALSDLLAAHDFQADEVQMHTEPPSATSPVWDKWALQSLARRCRRGTVVRLRESADYMPGPRDTLRTLMLAAGFQWATSPAANDSHAQAIEYNPRWQARTTRKPQAEAWPAQGAGQRCAVIGGGLAGAAVAHALALRGYRVTVLDQALEAASGASGLPMGVLVPHVSLDDSPRSRLSRVGVQLMLQHAKAQLQDGVDYRANGVLQMTEHAEALLRHNPALVQQGWLHPGVQSPLTAKPALKLGTPSGLWHAHAGWMRPARMVRAWLQHPAIAWRGGATVQALERAGGVWSLKNAEGVVVLEAELVVLANADGAAPLLRGLTGPEAPCPDIVEKIGALQALHGTVSHGEYQADAAQGGPGADWPDFAVNGSGSWVSPDEPAQPKHWYAGATYAQAPPLHSDCRDQHAANWAQLSALVPEIAASLSGVFAKGGVQAWCGVRCITHDRLPLVGPVDAAGESGLWLTIGLGSRGLSLSALCAELLAARIGREPLPIEARLARSLDVHRTMRAKSSATSSQPDVG